MISLKTQSGERWS